MDRLGQPAMLITDYVAPDLADALKERGIPFLDAAGNAYIKQANLLIWIKGQKPAAKRPSSPLDALSSRPAYK